jgi:hypothetical protein
MHEDTYEPVAMFRTVIFSLQFTHRHISITLFRETNLTLTYRIEDTSVLGCDTRFGQELLNPGEGSTIP